MTRAPDKRVALRCGVGLFILHLLFSPIEGRTQDSVPWSQDVAPAFFLADSGVKVSGLGNHWSHWYQLGVGESPEGYTVSKVEFWLTGDSICGKDAECREIVRSDKRVLWEFRLRGKSGQPLDRPAHSEGHIRVTYRHK